MNVQTGNGNVILGFVLHRESLLRPVEREERQRSAGPDCHPHHRADQPLPLRYHETGEDLLPVSPGGDFTVWCSGVGTLLQCQAMLGPGGTQEHGGLVICPAQNSDSHRGLSQVNMGTPRLDNSTVSTQQHFLDFSSTSDVRQLPPRQQATRQLTREN